MEQIILTREIIEGDIVGFEARIQAARDKLSELPAAASTYKERKKLMDKRRKLQQEIKHVRGLISMAREALEQSE